MRASATKRRCGTCTACCTALGVPELSKPAAVRCEHVARSGCRRYGSRPPSCAVFDCLWLQGVGASGDRPDRTQVVCSVAESPEFGQVVQIHEAGAGAWERSDRARALAEKLALQYLVILVRPLRRTIVGGPDALLSRAAERVTRRTP